MLDARSGRGIPGATVEIAGGAGTLESDGSGSFRSRGLDPGRYRILVRHFGYADGSAEVEVRNGELSRLLVELHPVAFPVEGIVAHAEAAQDAGVVTVGQDRIARLGARTAGDAVLALPGVRLVERAPGGAQTLNLRGSGGGQILVLVDGVPLNDPITGEADLSTIPAASIEELSLLRGGRSARYGPRAQGGALLIRTRSPVARGEAGLSGGSLGEKGARLGGGWTAGSLGLGIAGELRELRGDFRFVNPAAEDGELRTRRENADLRQLHVRGSADGRMAGGTLRARVSWEEASRGLPGLSFAPSRSARQDLRRGRASIVWRRDASRDDGSASPGSGEISLYHILQTAVSEDPRPPFGHPYEDKSRLAASGFRAELSRAVGPSRRGSVGGGLDVRHQRVRSDLLALPEGNGTSGEATTGEEGGTESPQEAGGAAVAHSDVGLFLRGRFRLGESAHAPELSLVARAHRDGLGRFWHAGHEATFSVPVGALSLHLAHRSSFSPPTLGDHFFREGVGISPNPDLRGERVPSEWEVGISGSRAGERASISAGAEAFRGDVRDMIVWAPDFRFVWSPRNFDTERSGAGVWSEVHFARERVRLSGSYSYARITYGRSGTRAAGEPGVQLAYRPRHSGSVTGGWEWEGWKAEVTARYTGLRYPVPAAINEMPPFWTFGASLARTLTWSGWEMHPLLRADRLFDRRDSLIFGFPEPGRTLFLELRLARKPSL